MAKRPSGEGESLAGRLYDAYGAALYRYALMLLADRLLAEDAVQQVFAAIVRQGPRLRLEAEEHYLRRAVRNACYSMRRSARADAPLLESVPEAPRRVSAEERLALERAIGELPIEQREVIHLHVFEGMTLQEVANATDESINTVASRYRYAVAKLRERLSR